MLTDLSRTGMYWQDTKELAESIREQDQGKDRCGRELARVPQTRKGGEC